jgi:hypothetical protein
MDDATYDYKETNKHFNHLTEILLYIMVKISLMFEYRERYKWPYRMFVQEY